MSEYFFLYIRTQNIPFFLHLQNDSCTFQLFGKKKQKNKLSYIKQIHPGRHNRVWLSTGGLLVSVVSVRTDSAGSSHAT